MRDDSWEWYFWATNPSPLEGLMIWCKAAHCKQVLPYHGEEWRESNYDDFRYYRQNGGFAGWCPKCTAMIKALKEEQEEDDEQ